MQIELPCYYAETDPELSARWREAWSAAGLDRAAPHGQAFWMQKR